MPSGFDSRALVSLVQAYPCLYDPSVPDYQRKEQLDRAWNEIGHILNENPSDCRTRWSNIRGTYSKHLSSKTKRNYYLEHHLAFLQPYIKSRKSMSLSNNLNGKLNKGFEESKIKEEVLTEEEELGESDIEEEDLEEEISRYSQGHQLNQSQRQQTSPISHQQQLQQMPQHMPPPQPPVAQLQQIPQSPLQPLMMMQPQTQIRHPVPRRSPLPPRRVAEPPPLKRIKKEDPWHGRNGNASPQDNSVEIRAKSPAKEGKNPEHKIPANPSPVELRQPTPQDLEPPQDPAELVCPEMLFLRSLLPDVQRMTPEQNFKFRTAVLQTIGEILYQ